MAGGGSRSAARNNAWQDCQFLRRPPPSGRRSVMLVPSWTAAPGRRFRQIAFRSTVESGRLVSATGPAARGRAMISVFELFKIGDRPVVVAHGRADEGRRRVRGRARRDRRDRPGRVSRGRAARLARLHRARPRDRQGGRFSASAVSGRTASNRTPPKRSSPRCARRSACSSPGGGRSPSIRRRAIVFDIVDSRAAPSQHLAPRRARRGRRGARRRDLAFDRRRLHRPRRRRRGRLRDRRRACPIRSARAPSFWRAAARPGFRSPSSCAPTRRRLGRRGEVDAHVGARPRRHVRLRRPRARRNRARCRAGSKVDAPRQGDLRPPDRGVAAQFSPGARDHGFRQRLCDGGQRGERGRRAGRHRADQRRGRRHSGGRCAITATIAKARPGRAWRIS